MSFASTGPLTRRAALLGVLAVLAALVALGGCSKASSSVKDREVDHSLVRLASDRLNLRHDRVGHDQWASQATFALIDAHNDHTDDLLVTLRAGFTNETGKQLGQSDTQSLRIPAGGVRTFALVDDEQKERLGATTVKIEVLGAYVPNYAPPVQVTDGNIYRDGDRVVANAMIRNAIERPVYVIVIAGFYDENDKPLTRPFTSMYVQGNGSHPAEFVGPPGSVKGYIFVGDMKY